MKIEKSRLMELSGFNEGRQPLLILESGQAIYSYDLAEMIQQEMRKVMQEMQIRKAENDIMKAQASRSASAAMGFSGIGFGRQHMSTQRPVYGAGGTRGFLGHGFR